MQHYDWPPPRQQQQQQQQQQHRPPPPPQPQKRKYYDEYEEDSDDYPNMASSSSAPTSAAASSSAAAAIVVERVCQRLPLDRPTQCPFTTSSIGELEPSTRAEFTKHYHIGPGGVCCRGSKRYTVAELYAHARDTVSKSDVVDTQGVHELLVAHLDAKRPDLKEAFERNSTAQNQSVTPLTFQEQVSWPPILLIHCKTDDTSAKLVKFKNSIRALTSNISEATGYHPLIGPPLNSSETSHFEGEIVCVFDGRGDAAKQDELLNAACRLRDECNAPSSDARPAFVREHGNGAEFVTEIVLRNLKTLRGGKALWKDIGGDAFVGGLSWKVLNDERARIDKERQAREVAAAAREAQLTSELSQVASQLAEMRSEREAERHAHEKRMEDLSKQFTSIEQVCQIERLRAQQEVMGQMRGELAVVYAGQKRNNLERKQVAAQMEAQLQEQKEKLAAMAGEQAGLQQQNEAKLAGVRAELERTRRKREADEDSERSQREELEKRYKAKEKAYEEEKERVRKEAEREEEEHYEEQIRYAVRMRPLQDAVNFVDECLLCEAADKEGEPNPSTKEQLLAGRFGRILRKQHRIKTIGDLDVGYMLEELGLPEEAQMEAYYWGACIRFGAQESERPTPPDGCPTFERALVQNIQGELEINNASPLVRDLRRRKQKARRKWAKVDEILDYLLRTDDEYRNSQPPAVGFEKAVWKTCTERSCNAEGRCVQGSPFVKDGWNFKRAKGEMIPKERLELMLDLQLQTPAQAAMAQIE